MKTTVDISPEAVQGMAATLDEMEARGWCDKDVAMMLRELRLQLTASEKWQAGWDAAVAFIDSEVGDPDITEEMRRTYAEFKRHRAILEGNT